MQLGTFRNGLQRFNVRIKMAAQITSAWRPPRACRIVGRSGACPGQAEATSPAHMSSSPTCCAPTRASACRHQGVSSVDGAFTAWVPQAICRNTSFHGMLQAWLPPCMCSMWHPVWLRTCGNRGKKAGARGMRQALVATGAAVDRDGVMPHGGPQESWPILLAWAEERPAEVERPHGRALCYRRTCRRHAGVHLLVAGLVVEHAGLCTVRAWPCCCLALHAGSCQAGGAHMSATATAMYACVEKDIRLITRDICSTVFVCFWVACRHAGRQLIVQGSDDDATGLHLMLVWRCRGRFLDHWQC